MSYKVIEKNEYGVLVIDNDQNQNICDVCSKCKYLDNCDNEWMECIINTYYLPDSEVEKLESETDLKAKNEALQTRIKELESTIENMKAIAGEKIEPINGISSVDYTNDNTTEVETFSDDVTECKSCGSLFEDPGYLFCPNCGRKIIRK